MEKILTVNEVAEILSVKPITVREMFREKRLRAFKVGKAWRTTETMLREDIEALAHAAVADDDPEAVPTPTGDDSMAKTNRPASKPSKKSDEKPANDADVKRPTGYPETAAQSAQDTTDPQWMAEAGRGENDPKVTGAEVDNWTPTVPAATKLMNQQEQISGARQAETAIPPEPERDTQPADDDKKSKKTKKKSTEQEQFEFDGLE